MLNQTQVKSPKEQRFLTLESLLTAKHGAIGLFRSLRHNSTAQGYRINALCPYFIDTPILGVAGKIALSGAALAKMDDAVEIASRTISDESINGRCYTIIPRATVADARELGLSVPADADGKEERAVWDVEDLKGIPGDKYMQMIFGLITLANKRKPRKETVKTIFGAMSGGLGSKRPKTKSASG